MPVKKYKRKLNHHTRRYLWPVLPTLLIVAIVILASRLKLFDVGKITCLYHQYPCPLSLEPVLVKLSGQNLFTLQTKNLTADFQALDKNISQVQVKKSLPNKLSIDIVSRSPLAQAVVDSSSETPTIFLIDENAQAFLQLNKTLPQIPTINWHKDQPLSLGSNLALQQITTLIKLLSDYYISFTALNFNQDGSLILQTTLGSQAQFLLSGDLAKQTATLQYVLSNLKIEEKVPAKIDLRFSKPILTY